MINNPILNEKKKISILEFPEAVFHYLIVKGNIYYSSNSLYSLQHSFKLSLPKTLKVIARRFHSAHKSPCFKLGFGVEFLSSADGATDHYQGLKNNCKKLTSLLSVKFQKILQFLSLHNLSFPSLLKPWFCFLITHFKLCSILGLHTIFCHLVSAFCILISSHIFLKFLSLTAPRIFSVNFSPLLHISLSYSVKHPHD